MDASAIQTHHADAADAEAVARGSACHDPRRNQAQDPNLACQHEHAASISAIGVAYCKMCGPKPDASF